MFNLKKSEVLNKSHHEFWLEDIAESCDRSEALVIKNRRSLTFREEYVFQGKKHRCIVNKTPIFSEENKIIAIAGLIIDLTHEMHLEKQLGKTKEFYQSMLANMGEALFFINSKGQFELVNKKAKEILAEIGFKGPLTYQAWLKYFPKQYDVQGKIYTHHKNIIPRALIGEPVFNSEVCLPLKNGTCRFFRASAIPLLLDRNEQPPYGVILTVNDITEEKQLLNELAQKTKLIEQRNEELHQFAYLAAHDLRDPLRNMSLSASLISEKIKQKAYGDIEELLAMLLNAASYGGLMVKSLLDYSAANQEMQIALVSLKEIVEQSIAVLNNLVAEAGATIIIKDMPLVMGNKLQLQLVFQNIIANAINHRGEKKLKIVISAKRKHQFWVVSIKDNGPGIPDKFKDEIFQPFKRLSANAGSRSTGLGLSICRRIIEQHGGEIWLDSQVNSGACFKFTLKAS